MSNAQATTTKNPRGRGKARRPAKSARARAMYAHIDALGINLVEAAKRARLDFASFDKAIHVDDPAKLRAKVIAALVGRLGMPLALVAPSVAAATKSSTAPPPPAAEPAASVA